MYFVHVSFTDNQMDYRWSYDDDGATTVCRFQCEQHTNCSGTVFDSVLMGTQVSQNPSIDYSVNYSDNNEDQIEIDIETISLNHFDTDYKAQPYQNILSDLVLSGGQVEEYLKVKNAFNEPVPEEIESKETADYPVVMEAQSDEWHYVQCSQSCGSPYRLAVNNAQNQLIELSVLPCEQPPDGQLYHLLSNPEETSPFREIKQETHEEQQLVRVELCPVSETCHPHGIPKEVVDEQVEQVDLSEKCKVSSPVQVYNATVDHFQPIREETQSAVHLNSAEELQCDAVGPSPSNPEPATDPVTPKLAIGPYCTAAGIFTIDVSLDIEMPHNRKKLPADQLKNGLVFELLAYVGDFKSPRRSLVKVLSDFFDLPCLDHSDPRGVERFFRRTITPLRTERAELVKCHALSTSRSASHKRRLKNSHNNPDLITQFDSTVFALPPIVNGTRRCAAKIVRSKEPKSRERKPTQAQQLHELQIRFDAFRHAQRKHNDAFLRYIHNVEKELNRVRGWPKRLHPNRRHPTPTT